MENIPKHISFKESFLTPFYFIIFLWLIHFFQAWFDWDLGYWGIYPRASFGLRGILFAPLLHSDWGHLASNSVPFLVLATMIIYFYPKVALRAFWILYFASGIAVWLLARSEVFHIGLSYVVYGLVSFVFWTGVFRRSLRSVVLALIVTVLYSGMVAGILPTPEIVQRNISWESHLLGGIMGILVAFYFKGEMEEDEKATPSVSNEEMRYYFDRDIFEKTKQQRLFEAEVEKRRRYEEWLRQQYNSLLDGDNINTTL
jgi:membrane associated rhomboid family serine protease